MHTFDYSFDMESYMTKERFAKLKEFASTKETPFLVTSLSTVARKYDELKNAMPYARVYYAIKANPTEEVLKLQTLQQVCVLYIPETSSESWKPSVELQIYGRYCL